MIRILMFVLFLVTAGAIVASYRMIVSRANDNAFPPKSRDEFLALNRKRRLEARFPNPNPSQKERDAGDYPTDKEIEVMNKVNNRQQAKEAEKQTTEESNLKKALRFLEEVTPTKKPGEPNKFGGLFDIGVGANRQRGSLLTPQPDAPTESARPPLSPLDLPSNYSEVNCFELAKSGSVDVYGSRVGTYHACAFTNVCLANQGQGIDVLVPPGSKLVGRSYEFPRIMFMRRYTSQYLVDATILEDAHQLDRYVKGTSVVMAHAYCCTHPTHYAEPLGALNSALSALRANATGSKRGDADDSEEIAVTEVAGNSSIKKTVGAQRDCPATSPFCIGKDEAINEVVELGHGTVGAWSKQMLKIALGDYDSQAKLETPSARNFVAGVKTQRGRNLKCFEKLVVPGVYYEIWPSTAEGEKFRESSKRYLSAQRRGGEQPEKEKWIPKALEGPNGFHRDPSRRYLLYSMRTSKRKVVDQNEFVDFLKVFMKRQGGRVRTIKFGEHSFNSQAGHAQDADIIVGIHGADLSNMIFQEPGKVLIEINPLFFFEPRFKLMAERLSLHYMPWTCTSNKCAFGGIESRVKDYERAVKQHYTFHWDKRVIQSKEDGNFTWPFDKYIDGSVTPKVCDPCDRMLCCSPAKSKNWQNRETDVKVGEHLDEFAVILVRAAKNLGWIDKTKMQTSDEEWAEARSIVEEYKQWKSKATGAVNLDGVIDTD